MKIAALTTVTNSIPIFNFIFFLLPKVIVVDIVVVVVVISVVVVIDAVVSVVVVQSFISPM